jgi:hypothetical protein
MVVVWGSGLYGTVDRVPGLCYVATRFGHLWYIPLIPLGSYLILDLPGDSGTRGRSIPLSMKSLLFGWIRAACVIGMVGSAIVVLVNLLSLDRNGDEEENLLLSGMWFAGSAAALALTYLLNRAGTARAVQLGQYLGLSEEAMRQMLVPKEQRLKDLEAYLGANPDALSMTPRNRPDEGESEPPPETSVREG